MEAVRRLCPRALGKTQRYDWETIAGEKDQLVGRIQERYGLAKAEAERQADANRGSLVQVDAHGADVAFTRPVRVPDVRAAGSRVLGRAFADCAAWAGGTVRNAGPNRFGDGKCIEDPMFVTMALAGLVLLSLILSLVPGPGVAAPPRS